MVISFALLLKEEFAKKIISSLRNEENIFLWGFVSFIIGVAMIFSYNVWTMNWRVIITILGWAALIKGLLFLYWPKTIKNCAGKMENNKWLPLICTIVLILGLTITYLGFSA